MKINKWFIRALFPTLCPLFFIACNWDGNTSNTGTFAYELRGTWETNQNENEYFGTLVIGNSTIKITGYGATYYEIEYGGVHERPFGNITRNVERKGYSEDSFSGYDPVIGTGKIYIEDFGEMHEFSFDYEENKNQDKLLLFVFGGREEKLLKK